MDIRDAMAEAILRDVLANPGKYWPDLAMVARGFDFLLVDNNGGKTIPEGWPQCFGQWKDCLALRLSQESPEQNTEDNGKPEPDARDF